MTPQPNRKALARVTYRPDSGLSSGTRGPGCSADVELVPDKTDIHAMTCQQLFSGVQPRNVAAFRCSTSRELFINDLVDNLFYSRVILGTEYGIDELRGQMSS